MYHEIYKKNEDGTFELVSKVPVENASQEDIIAEKEAQLLAMYNELQALKNSQQL